MKNFIPRKISGYRSNVINKLIDCVNMLYPIQTPTVRREFTPNGVKLNVSFPDSAAAEGVDGASFSVSIEGNQATVKAGSIRVSWGNYAVSGALLSLSGSTAWIYVYANKGSLTTNGIQYSASEPISTGATFQWPLVKATTVDGGVSYSVNTVAGDIKHIGDFYFYSPINKP